MLDNDPTISVVVWLLSCVQLLHRHGLAHQAPLSMGFPRQQYWDGLPFPSPGDLPYPGAEPMSALLQVVSLPTEPPEKATSKIAFNVFSLNTPNERQSLSE